MRVQVLSWKREGGLVDWFCDRGIKLDLKLKKSNLFILGVQDG